MLEIGTKLPEFALKSHDGEAISLNHYPGKWVIMHTFPLAFTGG